MPTLDGQRYSGDLRDRRELARWFEGEDAAPSFAQSKADLFAECAAALSGVARPTAYYVPGRIEVLGKHTDYAGGSTMVVAAERAFCFAAGPRGDSTITVTDARRRETIRFEITPDLEPTLGHWRNYPMTVARRIARNFPGARRGADIALASDLPPAAGMSSSSAMIVGVFLILADANDLPNHPRWPAELNDPVHLAEYAATIENGQSYGDLAGDRGVGTFGGSEDHTAILCARRGSISQYAYCPVRFERLLPVPEGYIFAVGSSGVVAEKTGAAREKYNRASFLAAKAAELWRRYTGRDDPHLAAVLRSGPDAEKRIREAITKLAPGEAEAAPIIARFEQFRIENEEVLPAAGAALLRGNLEEFGRWVDRSQKAAEDLLGNQIPETSFLAAAAREEGAAAASAFGAGFGGSVWALVEAARAEEFLERWRRRYRERYPGRAHLSEFFLTGAGPAAFRLA